MANTTDFSGNTIKQWFASGDTEQENVKLNEASLLDLQLAYQMLSADVAQAEPQVAAMQSTLDEAKMILDNMKYRRGKVAYWLSLRKAQ